MYERFTDSAKKVMQKANEAAHELNHEYIGTEHILLGLLTVGVHDFFSRLAIQPDAIRRRVFEIIQAGPEQVTLGRLPQTPRGKKVIEFAMEEARGLEQSWVGTEHILLGLIRENEGVAGIVLKEWCVKLEEVRHLAKGLDPKRIQEMSPEIKAALDDLVTESRLAPGEYVLAIRTAIATRRGLQIISDAMSKPAV